MSWQHKSSRYKPLALNNPFEAGDRAFADILAQREKEKGKWQMIAVVCLICVGISFLVVMYAISRQSVVPVYVYVSELGEARYMGKGKVDTKVTEAEIQWLLRDFLTKIRTLPADGEVLYNNAVAAYNFVTRKCEEKLTEDFRKDTTFEKVGKSRRYVSIESVLKLSEKSYQLDWVETGEGAESFVRKMRGVFTVELREPVEETIKVNPRGIYVENYDITVLQERRR